MTRTGPVPLARVEADPGAPLVLGIDTTCASDSVALVQGDIVLASLQVRRPRRTGAALAPAIGHVLAATSRRASDLAAIAVVTGPGSFVGLRVGIATAQGMACGLGIPTFACSATVAWAACAPACGLLVGVGLDARRGQVYSALYRVPGDGTPEELAPPRLQDPDAWLRETALRPDLGAGVLLVGDGSRLYRDLAREILGARAVSPAWSAMAPNVGQVALEGVRRLGLGLASERLVPVYLRDHDAARQARTAEP